MYEYYKSLLLKDKIDTSLSKYLNCKALIRLKNIGYFCGMDYASKDIYNFNEYISRYDHSLDVALLSYKYTKDKKAFLAGLFHDISTPCFSHVIDYMNKDYIKQESTEKYTLEVLKRDKLLIEYLKEDNIDIEDISNFKKYSIVDNDRPKLCADRLDGVFLTGMFWTKNISTFDISNALNHLTLYNNLENEMELGFDDYKVAKKLMDVNNSIDIISHSNEDNFMMELLASLTKYVINNEYLNYEDLYILTEDEIHNIFNKIEDKSFKEKYILFKTIKLEDVPLKEMPYIKKRNLKLLVNGKRIIN